MEAETLPLEAEMQQKWATRGGWAAKSHVVSKHPIFKGLPTKIIMHGVYENVHPEVSISKIKGDYIAGLIGYDHFPNNEIMRRHFNGPGEVWWAADVLETQFGEGKMLLSTLRIIEFLDTDPVAEKLLYNIIDYISK
jgi:beta-galactosidase